MERAIFISKISQLGYLNRKYSRIYFGNEFCQRLIPSIPDLMKVLTYIKGKGLDFSLVTPYVTNEGIMKLEALFGLLKTLGFTCEVVVNDWGVLYLVNRKYPKLIPILGRLLTKQKRGPRIIKLLKRDTKQWFLKDKENPKIKYLVIKKKLPLELDPYYKGSNTSSVPLIHNFLISQRIKRIELDNPAQGLFLNLPKGKISASVYLPYVYISTTFFCPTVGCNQKEKPFLKIKPCNRECQKYIFKLRHKTMPKVIFLKGNTFFYKCSRLSIKELEGSGVDRIVYEPEIPV